MRIIGLTGSIGMGKSTAARFFRAEGIAVHDADEAVHRLYRGKAAPLIEAAFPGTTVGGTVDRAALGRRVIGDATAIPRLEAIVHPLVREEEAAFLAREAARGADLVVLDIPLLLETGSEGRCDVVVVVSAPADVQRERVLSRPGMSEDKFAALLAKQMPDEEKRKRAHLVIDSGRSLAAAHRQVADIVRAFVGRAGGR